MTRLLRVLPIIALAAVLSACGGGGKSDNSASKSVSSADKPPLSSEPLYAGQVTVGLTDVIPASGVYTPRTVFAPAAKEVLAVILVDNAKAGTTVLGRWYQTGTLQPRAQNLKPEGILLSEANFTITQESISQDTKKGGGRLRLVPTALLPQDSYILRVYVDGKLARTAGFVVSQDGASPPPAATSGPLTVSLTDAVSDSGAFSLRDTFAPDTREIMAIVKMENPKVGTKVLGRWYQTGTVQQQAPSLTPLGALVSEAGFTMTQEAVNLGPNVGGRLRLLPSNPLPQDFYVLQVFVDGKLARTLGFAVVR